MMNAADTAVIVVCGLALVAAMTVAQAQVLPDPTRPPAFENTVPAAAGAAPAATGLQSIIRSNCGKPAAIINGAYVALGGRVGDARVVAIGEDFVTLKGPSGKETLKLMPGVEKTPVAGGTDAAEKKGICATNPDEKSRK